MASSLMHFLDNDGNGCYNLLYKKQTLFLWQLNIWKNVYVKFSIYVMVTQGSPIG